MNKKVVTIAKTMIDGKIYFITDCSVLMNEPSAVLKRIKEEEKEAKIVSHLGFDIINPTYEFIRDMEKLLVELFQTGERFKCFKGDYDIYYITSYEPVKQVFDFLDSIATNITEENEYGGEV